MITVAIVGKPNVGKSTLFNRIINNKKAIVDDQPGITRDRIFGIGEWLNRQFRLIDTGGYSLKESTFQENINLQVKLAIDEADFIIFLTSYQNGVDNDDIYVAKLLKKYGKSKKIILACNKAENFKYEDISKFYNLGFANPIMVSSVHGIGIGDLLDAIVKSDEFKQKYHCNPIDTTKTTFCIIGRPNVGKSSLMNAILNENRVIVSEIPGTTIDAIDVDFSYNKHDYTIIDTAGIRKKGKIIDIEKYAFLRSEFAISRSNIIVLVLDGSVDFNELDERVAGFAFEANIPILIVVNKIDLIDNFDQFKQKEIINNIRQKFKFIPWAPIIFVSSSLKKNINKVFNSFEKINNQLNLKVSTSLLNDVILKAQMLQQAPIFKGSRIEISYVTQVKSQIPTFVLFCKNVKSLHFSYARYIENKVRTNFGLDMVPLLLYWKDKNDKKGISIEKIRSK